MAGRSWHTIWKEQRDAPEATRIRYGPELAFDRASSALDRSANVAAGRHNIRDLDTIHQMTAIARGMDHKRLRYKDLVA